ncbi:subtilisin-like protease sbt4.9 [Quercus suber]|uniref:Subtilisin-like protease sbt4.9 n=1 Tax=Quercus suber TaxID=58331 RepID=A0AAW0J298_QUESU
MQFKALEFCHTAMAAKSIFLLFLHIFMSLIISISTCYGGATDKTKDLYIVYMGSLPESDYSSLSHHLSILQEVLGERICPTKDYDLNLDGEIDHEEFVKFIQQLTAETLIAVSQGLIVSLVVAPTVAMATKRATKGVPGVGKVVQRLPNSVYASLVTIAVVFIQQSIQESD